MDESLTAAERSALQTFFLRRLAHLRDLQRRHQGRLNPEGHWLVAAATFSTFCDCRDLGVAEAALHLLAGEWSEQAPGPSLTTTAPESS